MNSKKKTIIYISIFLLLILASLFLGGKLETYLVDNELLKGSSLFLVALIIGLVDGFNPCAMWILIYLITLVSELKDRKKMWFVVGTFLLASGLIYFIILSLYLAGWELAIYLGYTKWIIYIASIFAIGSGSYFLYDYYKTKGEVVCKVENPKARKKTMDKIKQIVHSPLTIPTVIALFLLAFSVNLVEFFCSIGLPQTFTNLLSISNITMFEKFFYILIYILGFMADDLIIFYFGLKAIESPILAKYSGFSKLVGGVVMVLLGIWLFYFQYF